MSTDEKKLNDAALQDPKKLNEKINEMFSLQIKQWNKTHPGKQLPIVLIKGEPVWLTRKMRLANLAVQRRNGR